MKSTEKKMQERFFALGDMRASEDGDWVPVEECANLVRERDALVQTSEYFRQALEALRVKYAEDIRELQSETKTQEQKLYSIRESGPLSQETGTSVLAPDGEYMAIQIPHAHAVRIVQALNNEATLTRERDEALNRAFQAEKYNEHICEHKKLHEKIDSLERERDSLREALDYIQTGMFNLKHLAAHKAHAEKMARNA